MLKSLPKIQKVPSEISGYFSINVNLKLYFSFFILIANIDQEIKVSHAYMEENVRNLTKRNVDKWEIVRLCV